MDMISMRDNIRLGRVFPEMIEIPDMMQVAEE